jgi:ribosomal protein L44E
VKSMVTKWKLRCHECDTEWMLAVSFNLMEMKKIYHYCRICRKNAFHDVLERIDE